MKSPEIEREVGGRIKLAKGWRVDLDEPELTISVEMLTSEAFYTFAKERGPGGLPTGVSGKVACLLSGGIDSPVAAWRMMKRGCSAILVHFHSYPFLSRASQEKVRELAQLLTTLPAAHAAVPRRLRRDPAPGRAHGAGAAARRDLPPADDADRRADRAGERRPRARHRRGDRTGRLADAREHVAHRVGRRRLPILRPLVGMDKEEIVEQAGRLGSFEISIVPDQDCCQLFTPKHPATRARRSAVEEAESRLPIEEMVNRAVEQAEVEQFQFPAPPGSQARFQFARSLSSQDRQI